MLAWQWVGVIMPCIHASKRYSQFKFNNCGVVPGDFVRSFQRLENNCTPIDLKWPLIFGQTQHSAHSPKQIHTSRP